MDQLTIGQRIAQCRRQAGLSQEALGEKMGVSRQAISKWESDGSIPEIDKLIALSRLFSTTVGWLLGIEQAPDAPVQEHKCDNSQPKPRKHWAAAAMVFGIGVILLCLIMAGTYRSTAEELRRQVDTLTMQNGQLRSELSLLSSRMEQLVQAGEEQNRILSEYRFSFSAGEADGQILLALRAVPKAWCPTDRAELVLLVGEDSRTAALTAEGAYLTGSISLTDPSVTGAVLTIFHEDGTSQQQALTDDRLNRLGRLLEPTLYGEPGREKWNLHTDGSAGLQLEDFLVGTELPEACETWEDISLLLLQERDGKEIFRTFHSLLNDSHPDDVALREISGDFLSGSAEFTLPALQVGDVVTIYACCTPRGGHTAQVGICSYTRTETGFLKDKLTF